MTNEHTPEHPSPETLSGDPALDLLYAEPQTLHWMAGFISNSIRWSGCSVSGLSEHDDYMRLLHGLYGATDNRELSKKMAEYHVSDEKRRSDISIWKELQSMARFGFEEEAMKRNTTGFHFVRDIPEMSRPGYLFGAALAVHELFGPNVYTEDPSREAALRRMMDGIDLSETDLTHLIRITAINTSGGSWDREHLSEGDRLLLEACKEPSGLVRRALSDNEGQIDLSYFQDDRILEQNARMAFDAMVSYDDSRYEAQRGDYAVLKATFPEQFAAIEQDPEFLTNAVYRITERIYKFSDDRRVPQYQGELLPPADALEVVPTDAIVTIAKGVLREIEQWIPTVQKPLVGSEVEAMLKGIGPDYVEKTRGRARRGMSRIAQSLVEFEAVEA